MHAARAADAMNRHDVLVMQMGRRLRLVFEALQLLGIEGGRERQYLEGHAAAKRDLHRLVDHAHAAPADLPDKAVVAQRGFGVYLRGRRRGGFLQLRCRSVNELQTVKALRQRLADVGMPRLEVVPVRFVSGLQRGAILLEGADHARIVQGHQLGHRRLAGRRTRARQDSGAAVFR